MKKLYNQLCNLNLIRLLLFLSLLLYGAEAMAQDLTVSGKVTDQDGAPLAGATVLIDGSQTGTITNPDGSYSIAAATGDVLLFDYMGYQSAKENVGSRSVINVAMLPDATALDDIVVIGYGAIKKSDLTGSVASVNTDDMVRFPASNISEMLRGQAAGVQVTTSSSAPGGSASISVRGVRTLSSSQTPLYIVDGMTVPHLDDINSSDIQSIEILKDASSQAIYGARASNGVVLVTTKKGEKGKVKVDLSSYVAIQQMKRNFDMWTAEEWAELRYWGMYMDGTSGIGTADAINYDVVLDDPIYLDAWNNQSFTNWEDLMITDALQQKHDVTISGGTDKLKASVNLGYFDQEGLVVGSGYERMSSRIALDWSPYKWLDISYVSSVSMSTRDYAESNFNDVVTTPIFGRAYDDDGNLVQSISVTGGYNPLYLAEEHSNQRVDEYYTNNLGVTFKIIDGLTYRVGVNLRNGYRKEGEYYTTLYPGSTGEGELLDYEREGYVIDNVINYNVPIKNKKHTVGVTLIQSAEQDLQTTTGFDFNNSPSDEFAWNMAAASDITSVTHSIDRSRVQSYAARVQYSLMDRYLFTASVRRDGASVLGDNNKWGTFPSAAVAYKISEEEFMKQADWVDLLKLRVSYGVVGNSSIPSYTTQGEAVQYEYLFGDGYSIAYLPGTGLVNSDLKWETTASTNVGVDLTAFNGRLNVTLEGYNTYSKDLLINRTISSASGYSTMWDNLGRTQSYGYEAAINGHIFSTEEFSWSVGLTWAMQKNKILEIDGSVDDDGNPVDDSANDWYIGKSINADMGYAFGGIWQTGDVITENDYLSGSATPVAGDVKLMDWNGDGVITTDDQRIYELDPAWYGSFTTSVYYKGFDLSLEFYTVQDIWKQNQYLYNYDQGGNLTGKLNGMKVDYWTPDNPSNTAPAPHYTTSATNFGVIGWQDASYFRLRLATLGYTLPEHLTKKLVIQKARVYVSGTNLFTITDYLSYSPEQSASAYPEPQTFTLGVNITF